MSAKLRGMTLAQAIQHIDTATEPFSLKAVKYDDKKQTGGDIISLYQCLNIKNIERKGQPNSTTKEKTKPKDPNIIFKDPAHYKNFTRNIINVHTKEIKKIHIWLIIELNGNPVKM